ncbi:MAG TPA: hypothetical protein VJ441_03070 [Dehalococcoidia bacterium]|nr:hypothetical protein [Dehalococcoidia bacterium]
MVKFLLNLSAEAANTICRPDNYITIVNAIVADSQAFRNYLNVAVAYKTDLELDKSGTLKKPLNVQP